MFYSQFILAKKGPLGTIWIAAHLERKLRKNQVADTDIGVSVDSILCPDVPIALRLSSHLLLGVVRIYNRKVNYLFDDCSEALLKIKQAFRSTAVDLPPEESKAPYHTITLPEKFDLDDFELPDSDIFQGNYVDNHISSREQITLQETMEGVSYSMSKFGLDERFGDVDASGLVLDEELFLGKIGTAGDADERVDADASFGSTSTFKQTQHSEDRAANSGSMVDGVPEGADVMDYAQAPRTPGLVEEPNVSKVASACDDHLESENHLVESTIRENTNSTTHEDKQEVDWSSRDDIISDPVPQGPAKENGYLSGGLEVESSKAQGEFPVEANAEFGMLKESSSVVEPSTKFLGQIESVKPSLEFTNEILKASDVPSGKVSPTEAASEDKAYLPSVDEARCNHQNADEIGLEKSAPGNSGLASTEQQVSEGVSPEDVAPFGAEVPGSVGDASNQQKSCHDGSELASENRVGFQQETPETQACQGTTDSTALSLDAHDKEAASETLVLRPCRFIQECADVTKPGFSMSADDKKSDSNTIATDVREETASLGQNLKENQVQEYASCEDIQVATTEAEADGLLHTMNSPDKLVENLKNSAESELPALEKLLSVPEGHTDLHRGMMMEFSPGDFEKLDEGDAGCRTAAGRKRSFTESTLTEQSLNSIESSRQVRSKQATGSVPNDDDLLSSILVGRRSSILRVKPTPPLSEVTSMKRTRSAPRSGAPKRKVLMDDTMVLHGDMIRQQLTNTEDIRRVRKKAPCTLPEISMIQKQHTEDEIFLEPIFTGISVELASLHSQVYDLIQIRICQSEVNNASLHIVTESRLPFQNNDSVNSPETLVEPNLASNNEKSGASLETTPELHFTSNNRSYQMEHSKGPSLTNIVGVSGRDSNDEFLTVEENETTELSKGPLLGENRLSIAFNVNEGQTKPSNDVGANDSEQELSLNVSVVGTSLINAGAASPAITEVDPLDSSGHVTAYISDASDGLVQIASPDESAQTNAYANTDTVVVPDLKKAAPSVDLGYADLDDGQAIVRNEDTEKDGGAGGVGETEIGLMDDILPDVSQDAAVIEVVSNADHGELESQNEIYSTTSIEQQEVRFSCPGPVSMLQDCPMNNCENPDHQEAYQPSLMDEERSGFDLHDRDELNYFAAENDTEFLNVDDDELTEMADEYVLDAEEAQYTENSGWSSRTRAVSKYLQSAFVKEAEHGRKSLLMDDLLNGKSRKEASRMFFEALVLKTRDYIHVEQRSPFDDITIKPRTRLMKSGF